MKISAILLLFFFTSCGTSEQDFNNMAEDICHCMTDSTVMDPTACMTEFEKKYEHLNSYDSDEEFQKNLISSMKKVKGCEEYVEFYEGSLEK